MASTAAVAKNLYTGTTSGVLYTDRRDFYPSPTQFAELFPSVSPFLTFTMRNNFRSGLADPVFKLFEFQAPWERQYLQVAAGAGVAIAAASTGASTESSAVTFDVAVGLPYSSTSTPALDASMEGVQFEVWDSTGVTKKGVVICTEGTSATTAKFKNLGGTAITTAEDDYFVAIGQATEEGVVAPAAWASELKVVWNQCQIFRTTVEITGTLQQAALRGATKELARLRAEKAAEHKMRMERAFLYGASPLGTNLAQGDTFSNLDKLVRASGGKPVRTTVGMVRAIELYGNSTDGNQYQSLFNINSATYGYNDLIDDLEIVFQYVPNSGVKPAFVGAGALGFWTKKIASEDNWGLDIQNGTNEIGAKVKKLMTPHGDLDLSLSHAMKYEHKNQMLIVDPRNVEYVEYRPSRFSANIKTDDGYDGVKDEYFSDAGLGITNIKAHQLFNIGG